MNDRICRVSCGVRKTKTIKEVVDGNRILRVPKGLRHPTSMICEKGVLSLPGVCSECCKINKQCLTC